MLHRNRIEAPRRKRILNLDERMSNVAVFLWLLAVYTSISTALENMVLSPMLADSLNTGSNRYTRHRTGWLMIVSSYQVQVTYTERNRRANLDHNPNSWLVVSPTSHCKTHRLYAQSTRNQESSFRSVKLHRREQQQLGRDSIGVLPSPAEHMATFVLVRVGRTLMRRLVTIPAITSSASIAPTTELVKAQDYLDWLKNKRTKGGTTSSSSSTLSCNDDKTQVVPDKIDDPSVHSNVYGEDDLISQDYSSFVSTAGDVSKAVDSVSYLDVWEGDQVVVLGDELGTKTSQSLSSSSIVTDDSSSYSPPKAISMSFGRPLEVLQNVDLPVPPNEESRSDEGLLLSSSAGDNVDLLARQHIDANGYIPSSSATGPIPVEPIDEARDKELPILMHKHEGDRIVALADQFDTTATSTLSVPALDNISSEALPESRDTTTVAVQEVTPWLTRWPEQVSMKFGRALEIVEIGIPPLRVVPTDAIVGIAEAEAPVTNTSNGSVSPRSMLAEAENSPDNTVPRGSFEEEETRSSCIRDLSIDVAYEKQEFVQVTAIDAAPAPDKTMTTRSSTLRSDDTDLELLDAADVESIVHDIDNFMPDHENVEVWVAEEQHQSPWNEDTHPGSKFSAEPAVSAQLLEESTISADATLLHGRPTSAIATPQADQDQGATTTCTRADLQEMAFQILLNLGMIQLTPDPRDPKYDHSNDNDFCPDNQWIK